jgi:hypothetical protein
MKKNEAWGEGQDVGREENWGSFQDWLQRRFLDLSLGYSGVADVVDGRSREPAVLSQLWQQSRAASRLEAGGEGFQGFLLVVHEGWSSWKYGVAGAG